MSFELSSIVCDDDFGDTVAAKDVFLNKRYGLICGDELCCFCFGPFSEVICGNDDIMFGSNSFWELSKYIYSLLVKWLKAFQSLSTFLRGMKSCAGIFCITELDSWRHLLL